MWWRLYTHTHTHTHTHARSLSHLVSHVDAAAVQAVDVFFTFVHEAADQPVVAEDDAGHLGDVLVALVLADVAAVIHQAGHQVAPPPLLLVTLLYLQAADVMANRTDAKTQRKIFLHTMCKEVYECLSIEITDIVHYDDVGLTYTFIQ